MDCPEIVIRDLHRYGEDLTVPEAITRLCGGYPVTVTVTDPAPPGGDPRGNPRHGSGIAVWPAGRARRPRRPAKITWDGASCRLQAHAGMFAEALALAGQLATWARLGGGQPVLALAAAIGDGYGRDAARRVLADRRDITAGLDTADPVTGRMPAGHDIDYDSADLAARLGLDPADSAFDEAEDVCVDAASEAFRDEAGRIARERAAWRLTASPQGGMA